MYNEDKKNIGWLNILLKIIIIFLIFMLVIKLISLAISHYHQEDDKSYLKDNLKIMDKVAKEYFQGDNLPTKLGKSNKIALQLLVDKELIEELKDPDGKVCSLSTSFIQATKLDSEYQIKSYLECGDDSDYSNSFIEIEDNEKPEDASTTTTTKVTTSTTTKKVSTTKKKTSTTKKVTTTKRPTTTTTTKSTIRLYYIVDFNTNGGSMLPSQNIKPGGKLTDVVPSRPGYRFIGWYYNGKKFDMRQNIYQDYVLVAKWVKE